MNGESNTPMISIPDNYALDIRNVVKKYGDVTALHNVSLQIQHNEFFTLLGPSGCGKTTMLRIIAGFETLSAGEIYLHGEDIKKLPAHQRPVNTVFQNYALFPHMTVLQNIRFGLERRNMAITQANKRTQEMLELVRLSEYADRKPAQLSGGQQQRVALARALAPEPKILLLDESLNALDLKLRQSMRYELKQIQHSTGITFIFVTHDQDEALTMSDRIAVMSNGRIQQIGTAQEIYEQPANCFVAGFIGETNLLQGTVQATNLSEKLAFVVAGGHKIMIDKTDLVQPSTEKCYVSIRPERIHIAEEGEKNTLAGTIEHNVYIGATTESYIRLNGGPLVLIRLQNPLAKKVNTGIGQRVHLQIEMGAVRFFREEERIEK